MKMTGSIEKELIKPATNGRWSGERRGGVKIPYMFEEMSRNIRKIADVTRTDDPFNGTQTRSGNVITRKKVAVV